MLGGLSRVGDQESDECLGRYNGIQDKFISDDVCADPILLFQDLCTAVPGLDSAVTLFEWGEGSGAPPFVIRNLSTDTYFDCSIAAVC